MAASEFLPMSVSVRGKMIWEQLALPGKFLVWSRVRFSSGIVFFPVPPIYRDLHRRGLWNLEEARG